MVSEKMGLPFYRRRRGRRGRPVRNTNFMEKWLFSIIYFEKTIQSIFMKFSGFVYHVKTIAIIWVSTANTASYSLISLTLLFFYKIK